VATIVLDGSTERFPDGTTVRPVDPSIADGELMPVGLAALHFFGPETRASLGS
jgi:hypothetical protein